MRLPRLNVLLREEHLGVVLYTGAALALLASRPGPIEFTSEGHRLAMRERGRLVAPQGVPNGFQVGRYGSLPPQLD